MSSQKTKTPGSSYDSDSLNPANRLYEQEVNSASHAGDFDKWENEMSGDDFSKWEKEMAEDPAKKVREREVNTPTPTEIPYEQGPPPRKVQISRRQKIIGGGIGGGLIALILGFATFSPFGMLIHLKEIASDWADKFSSAGYHTRMKKVYKMRYFGADMCNGPIKIKCRLTPKIGSKELESLRRVGLDPELDANGRIRSMANPTNPKERITAANFDESYDGKPGVTDAFDEATASSRSISWRGFLGVDKMTNYLHLNRRAPLGDAKDQKEINKEFRKSAYTSQNDPPKYSNDTDTDPSGDPVKDSDIQKSLDDLFDGASEEAEKIKANVIENGVPPGSVVDAGIDPGTALKKLGGGTLDGAIKGPLGFIDSFCQLRRAAITTSTAIKLYQHIALIKYAAIFMVMADKMKTGDGVAEQMSMLGTAITRPSTQESSKGLTISESALVTLITEGKVADYNTAQRFTNGDTYTHIIDMVVGGAGGAVAASVCKKVEAWYGQVIVITTGVGSCLVTFGTTCVAGAIKGTIKGLALALIIGHFMPQIIQLLAGTVAPDPLTDPEGGYGIGNAIASGMGAFGLMSMGRGNALKPATKKEFALIAADVDRTDKYLASVEAYAHPGLFDDENPHGIPRQLALNFTPQMAALQSGSGSAIATSFASLFGSAPKRIGDSFASLFSPAYAASVTDKYRGELCQDPQIKQLDIATDAFCNEIFVPGDEILGNDPAFAPDKVIDYMVQFGHVDPDTGDAKSDKYKEYMDVCVKGEMPTIPYEDVDTKCYKTRNEIDYKYFRAYTMDNNIIVSLEQIEKGTFGKGESTATQTPDVVDPGSVSAEGWAWPATTPIHNGPCFGGPRGHAGMDINTTETGKPALAMHDGKVVKVGSSPEDAGNYIIIQATSSLYYGYEHLASTPIVKEGDTVKAGQQVGTIGRTGNVSLAPTTKGHLHIVLSTKPKLGGYGKLTDMLDPMTVLTSPAPGGYKCENR